MIKPTHPLFCHPLSPRASRLLFRASCILLAMSFGVVGCSSSSKPSKQRKVRHDWFYPTRQHAPEPVYSQLREVRPPEPIPEPPRDSHRAPRLMPVMQVNISNKSIGQAAQILADSYQYGNYCSPIVADQRISLRAIGTLDELAAQLAELGRVKVTVDHENRELRVLSGSLAPQRAPLDDGSGLENESQPVLKNEATDPIADRTKSDSRGSRGY